jgi:uncharacterized protein YggT (Ycf19 family)
MLSAIANPQPATVAEPGWQYVFISLAVVIILLEIIHGWRLGLVRQLVRVIAIIVAYSCAFFGARATVPIMRSLFKLPDPILAVLGGAILAAILFAAINLTGALLFRKTAQQESRFVRLIGGAPARSSEYCLVCSRFGSPSLGFAWSDRWQKRGCERSRRL